MKKLFLFLGAALFSLGVSAQEIYEVTVDNWDFELGEKAENNVEITKQLPALLKEGDMIYLHVKGYFDKPIIGVGVTCIVDNSGATEGEDGKPNYWIQLSEWKTENLGGVTAEKTLFDEETLIELNKDATSTSKIVIRMCPRTEDETVTSIKMRPTLDGFVEGKTYELAVPSATFGSDGGSNYKYQFDCSTDEAIVVNDIVKISLEGTFNQDIDGLNFMIFDKGGSEIMAWTARAFTAQKDKEVSGTFEFTMKNDVEGTDIQVAVFIAGYDESKTIKFLKKGDTEHDPVELAQKEYTNVTLSANVWTDPTPGSNYQYKENIATDVFGGDYVTFSIKGNSDSDFELLRAYLQNDKYSAISEYVEVAKNVTKDGSVEYNGTLTVSSASDVCVLVLEVPSEAEEGSSITIKEGSSSGPTAIDEVATSDFAVEGGMVYSAGEIVVYNVAGKVVATASQSFNVNSLAAGVYFISAQEGTIKFVK